ncbi:MAG: phytoene desaturase [Phycisphaera sp.]|nr:phytoene desaturase [Phycisphaera sp.]
MTPNLDQPIGVIGGGLAGLAAACTLASRGYPVKLFERNTWLGGKAAQLVGDSPIGRFRFDMGPTILTLPSVLHRIFHEADRKTEDYLDLVRLDPQWRCFFEDGSVLDLREEADAMRKTLGDFNADPGVAEGYARFVDYSQRLRDISDRFFFWKPIGSIRDMFDARTTFDIKTLKDVMAMRMGQSVAGTIRKYVPDARVCQMLDHFTQYVGSSPYASPAILCSIAHMQTHDGVWYPMGGTRAVPEALTKLATELGVGFHTGEGNGVKQIVIDHHRVVGVVLDSGEKIELSAVVSNMDAVRTHRELVGGDVAERFERRRSYEPACSGVVLYLGLRKAYEHVAHHDFVFSRDPEEEFDAIYKQGEPAPDPTCYLAATARTETAVAPAGGEALYVLVHTPYLRNHHNWATNGSLFRGYRQTILDKLKRTAGMEDIEERIVYEAALTPQDIHDRYRVLNGAIYGLASHGKFLGAFKPGNRSPDVEGLYLAGGAAHPGPGMPMVLMSGYIAGDTLDKDGVVHKTAEAVTV